MKIFRLAGFTRADPLPEVWLELRDESGGQVRTHRVQVIGVLADITTVSMNSVHVNSRAIAAVAGADVRPDTFFIKVAEGADARSVAQAVERAFLSSALDATVIADSAAQGQALTRGILLRRCHTREPLIGAQEVMIVNADLPGQAVRVATDGLRPFTAQALQ